MEKHHQESIDKFLSIYKKDSAIQAVLLGGSIAHGFAKANSDVDVFLVVEEDEFLKRKQEKKLAFSLWDICTYPGGYIDVKVVSLSFLKKIAERGSDPARYAFKDNIILYSKTNNLEALLLAVTVFPAAEKDYRRKRFVSQVLAWKWYYSEAVSKQNPYLFYLSVQKIILFTCRLILNENNMLYPYHKWLLNETMSAVNKPDDFKESVYNLMANHNMELVNGFCEEMLTFVKLEEKSIDWPNQFLVDSEQNWLEHEPPVDDL
jgi:predicted nucleotidyltransferase